MSLNTPVKEIDNNTSFKLTPVRFLESPTLKKISSDPNFATCKSRLDAITKNLSDNYDKWVLADKRGLALCSAIEATKMRCITAQKSSGEGARTTTNEENISEGECTLYPAELQVLCDKLAIISSIFTDITNSANESLRQLQALSKLPGVNDNILYCTWKLKHFIEFLEDLTERYTEENAVKQHVMEELPHSQTRAELITHTTAWEYPQFVNDWVSLMFAILKVELSGTEIKVVKEE